MTRPVVRGIRIATHCESVEQFLEKYCDRTEERFIFVGGKLDTSACVLDGECAFVFLLRDKHPVLAGTCIVRDAHGDQTNPFRRPGLRLHIRRLGPGSLSVFVQLREMRHDRSGIPTVIEDRIGCVHYT